MSKKRHSRAQSPLLRAIVLLFGVCGSLGASAQDTAISYGMSFSFMDVDVSKTDRCAASAGVPVRNAVFLTRYDQPGIRSRVQHDLQEMHASGFRDLRLIIFYGPNAKSPDWFDLNDGDRAARLLRAFVDDVKNAGFSTFYLVYGTQGDASPKCRKERWGDCFDPAYMEPVIAFISRIRAALGTPPIMHMKYDLAPEMCAPDNLPEPLRSNLLEYAKTVIGGYLQRFPKDETTMSCSLERFAGGRQSIDQSYAAAVGRPPSFYAIHSYNRADENEETLVRSVSKSVQDSKIPIVIGETSYNDTAHLRGLVAGLALTTRRIHSIYFWPLHNHSSRCTADVAPPYTLKGAEGVD